MTSTACALAALLTFEAATAPAAKECELTDDRCKAALYERRSVTAATANHRAQYLFNAHHLYVRLFDKSGDPRDLCAARRAIEASLAVDEQPETLRSQAEALRIKLLARAKQQRARCDSKPKRRKTPAEAPLLVRGPAPEPAERSPSAPLDPATPTAQPATTIQDGTAPPSTPAPTNKVPLIIDADPTTTERPDDATLMPVTSRRLETSPAPSPTSGRGLIVGGLTLGVGAAVIAAAGVMGHRAIQTRSDADAIHETFDGYAPLNVAAPGDALVHDFEVRRSQTIALALTGGMTVVLAAVLATLGARKMARARRSALVPGPGGLVFHGRF